MQELEEILIKMNADAQMVGKSMIANMKGYDAYHNKEMMKKDIEIAKLEGYIEGYIEGLKK